MARGATWSCSPTLIVQTFGSHSVHWLISLHLLIRLSAHLHVASHVRDDLVSSWLRDSSGAAAPCSRCCINGIQLAKDVSDIARGSDMKYVVFLSSCAE